MVSLRKPPIVRFNLNFGKSLGGGYSAGAIKVRCAALLGQLLALLRHEGRASGAPLQLDGKTAIALSNCLALLVSLMSPVTSPHHRRGWTPSFT